MWAINKQDHAVLEKVHDVTNMQCLSAQLRICRSELVQTRKMLCK